MYAFARWHRWKRDTQGLSCSVGSALAQEDRLQGVALACRVSGGRLKGGRPLQDRLVLEHFGGQCPSSRHSQLHILFAYKSPARGTAGLLSVPSLPPATPPKRSSALASLSFKGLDATLFAVNLDHDAAFGDVCLVVLVVALASFARVVRRWRK